MLEVRGMKLRISRFSDLKSDMALNRACVHEVRERWDHLSGYIDYYFQGRIKMIHGSSSNESLCERGDRTSVTKHQVKGLD